MTDRLSPTAGAQREEIRILTMWAFVLLDS